MLNISRWFAGGGDLLLRIAAILIAITFHEVAHGYVAYRLGDDTAKNQGRLSLNPIKHLDPLGALMFVIFRFGWAKPVPVNPLYFKGDRRRGMFLVGLAGPLTNFVLAFIAVLLLVSVSAWQSGAALVFLREVMFINVILGVFNLIPFPPLDGSKLLAYLLPRQSAYRLGQLEQYGPLVLILLLATGMLGRILFPLVEFVINALATIALFLTSGI
ncbi:MAG: site-2 protease family protein [Bacillota bacterium]|nr:site-2 protease family protein [Bacillota bacterium]MDW7684078.1 site-2 protease family protein [Bacillota bacterium]